MRKIAWKQMKTNQDLGLPRWHSGKESASQCRRHKRRRFDPWVRNIPWRKGNGNPLQYSCLENSMGREAWPATVHEVAKSQTWLSTYIDNQRLGNKSCLQVLTWKTLGQTWTVWQWLHQQTVKSQGDDLGCKTAWSHCTFKLKNFLEALHFAILSYLF